MFLVLALKVSSIVPIIQQLLFPNIIDIHWHEPRTALELFCAIDGDEVGRRTSLDDGKELVNTFLRNATPSDIGQNCEVVDIELFHDRGYFPEHGVQSWRLKAPDRMRDDIVAELVTLASQKTQAAFWESHDALGKDFVTFWKIRANLVCHAGKALDISDGQFAPGCLSLNRLFSFSASASIASFASSMW